MSRPRLQFNLSYRGDFDPGEWTIEISLTEDEQKKLLRTTSNVRKLPDAEIRRGRVHALPVSQTNQYVHTRASLAELVKEHPNAIVELVGYPSKIERALLVYARGLQQRYEVPGEL